MYISLLLCVFQTQVRGKSHASQIQLGSLGQLGASQTCWILQIPEIRQSSIQYAWSLGQWYDRLIEKPSDVPSII